jgi:hypothetical protein
MKKMFIGCSLLALFVTCSGAFTGLQATAYEAKLARAKDMFSPVLRNIENTIMDAACKVSLV